VHLRNIGSKYYFFSPVAEYDPKGHEVHESAGAGEKVPTVQGLHLLEMRSAYFPAEQIVHVDAFISETLPGPQVTQDNCSKTYWPAGQEWQLVSPFPDHVPSGQRLHLLARLR
jgi:hypothetical protein